MGGRRGIGRACCLAWLVCSTACDSEAPTTDGARGIHSDRAAIEEEEGSEKSGSLSGTTDELSDADHEEGNDPPDGSSSARPQATGRAPLPSPPIEHRKTKGSTMVYDAPSFSAAFRGRLPPDAVFAVLEHLEDSAGERCSEGWLQIHTAAYLCADGTKTTKKNSVPLPSLPRGMVTPHHYAKLKKGEDGAPIEAPVWRTRHALGRDEPPTSTLEPAHDYSFSRRIRTRNGPVLVREDHRAVRESDVQRFRPSDFAGRDLLEHPIPAGVVLAWATVWQFVPILAEPHPDARPTGRIRYHETVFLTGTSVRKRGTDYFGVQEPAAGWVDGSQIRRFLPFEPPSGLGPGELWIDVDLSEQTLTIMQGEEPLFVTLVSSGSWKDPTPAGLYRIEAKQALDDMRSRDGDEDEYFVEDVPWVMYFDGRYALHGTYWHNRFGSRTSHGCVNLAPRDARRVFDVLQPALPPGWLLVYEHAEDPGTLLRIRKGAEHPEDRRRPPRQRRASDYG